MIRIMNRQIWKWVHFDRCKNPTSIIIYNVRRERHWKTLRKTEKTYTTTQYFLIITASETRQRRRPIGVNVRAGVCVEFRSKGSPVRGGGVRASATAGDLNRRWPTIDFLTPGGIVFSTAAAVTVFSFPLYTI